jgi:hypothetical protein
MVTSPQVIEMLNELRDDELNRVNRHRIDALSRARHHDGVRRTVASALVKLGMTLDRDAVARAAGGGPPRSQPRAVDGSHAPRLDDGALHW